MYHASKWEPSWFCLQSQHKTLYATSTQCNVFPSEIGYIPSKNNLGQNYYYYLAAG